MRRRSVLYAVLHGDGRISFGHSPRPEVDRSYWLRAGAQRLVPLVPPLPPVWAELACRGLAAAQDGPAGIPGGGWRHRWFPSWLRRHRSGWWPSWLRRSGNGQGHPWSSHPRRPAGRDGDGQRAWMEAVQQAAARARQLLRAAGYDGAAGLAPGPLAAAAGGGGGPMGEPWADPFLGGPWSRGGEEAEAGPPPRGSLEAVAELLRGRLLTGAEVARQAEQAGVLLERSLEECLTWLVLLGRVQRWPGVYPTGLGGFRCGRCGETDAVRPWDCAGCGERQCWHCEACRSLGLVSGCVFLYAGQLDEEAPAAGCAPAPVANPVAVRLPALTPAQRRAAWALEGFVRQDERREALVWAVCGAGKTEVTFLAASRVLARGGRVLFAVPRRDVVQELGPRLAAAFPGAEVRVLHGGQDRVDRPGLAPGSLTVATTHQVLRFCRAFDLAILDEVDAFPYRGSPMLVRAVARAVRPGGRLVRMSATPDEALVEHARSGQAVLVPIPARHHGHPLPVPELLVDRSLVPGEGGRTRPYRPSPLVLSLVERSLAGTPPARLLVFVPTVALAEVVGRGLAAALAPLGWGGLVGWSHSRDPDRDRRRRAFVDGRLRLLVATTILERGITVPDVDVIVLFSDVEHIFQTAALVQMAGRVGRTAARPTGRVAFVGRRITRAMRAAVAQIEEMNRLAREMGLLKG